MEGINYHKPDCDRTTWTVNTCQCGFIKIWIEKPHKGKIPLNPTYEIYDALEIINRELSVK